MSSPNRSERGSRAGHVVAILLSLLLVTQTLSADEAALVALVQKGDAEDAQFHSQAALTAFLEAEKLAPNRVDVLLRISRQYSALVDSAKSPAEAQRHAEKSLSYAKRCIEFAPDNAKAHLSLAIAYGKLTDFTSNKTKLEYSRIIKAETLKSIALDPSDDYAYHVLGRWHLGVANLNPLLRALAKVVYGGLPEASNEEAVKNLKKAVALAPQRITHHVELAKAYAASGNRELARQEWQASLDLPAADSEDRQMQQQAKEALRR